MTEKNVASKPFLSVFVKNTFYSPLLGHIPWHSFFSLAYSTLAYLLCYIVLHISVTSPLITQWVIVYLHCPCISMCSYIFFFEGLFTQKKKSLFAQKCSVKLVFFSCENQFRSGINNLDANVCYKIHKCEIIMTTTKTFLGWIIPLM